MLLTDTGTTGIIFKGIRPLQRLGATALDIALNNPLAEMALQPRTPRRLKSIPPDPWPGDAQSGRDMVAGVFRFAGQSFEKDSLSWEPAGASPEWVASLHGFEWLRDLRSVGSDRARRMAREMVASWLGGYGKPHEIAWRPDITGVRVASWISFHDFFCAAAGDEFRGAYFDSLLRQAKYLSRTLPGDLSGVALMRALKGLAFSGLALEDGEQRLEKAFTLILRQVKEQILPDGAHISRSPQATFEFLQCLVDLRAALIAARLDMPEELQHGIDRITPAVKFFRHGDGGLAHFNGSQEGNAHLVETTLMHSGARGKAMKSLPHAGYERLLQGRSSLIVDTGCGPEGRHGKRAHAGLLSFEYSYGRERVIVNCGSSAAAGRWRDLLRSTAAHSTIVVDDRNACPLEGQGSFSAQPELRKQRQEDADIVVLDAGHGGYMPRFGLACRRFLRLQEDGETLHGEDILSGKSGVHFAIRFHLHPSIQASVLKEGEEVLLSSKSGLGWKFRAPGVLLKLEDSVYGGEGEHPRRTRQIVLGGVTSGQKTLLEWELRREKA